MRRSAIAGSLILTLALWGAEARWLSAQLTTKDLALGANEMIGEVAPPWKVQGWANSKALDVNQLRGKVILLRFLNDSPTGAASLVELYRTYRTQGLAVVGIYTPQPMPTPTDLEHIERLAAAQGFEFPVGLDARWETLNRYWLNRADAETGAATFVIDRKGVIRYVQPDGQYEKNSRVRAARGEYEKLEKQIQSLLKEETPNPGGAAGQRFFGDSQRRGRL